MLSLQSSLHHDWFNFRDLSTGIVTRKLMRSNTSLSFPQNTVYFHTKTPFFALASAGNRSRVHFTGGAILQKEREKKESSGESETRLTRRSGNWMAWMEPDKLLQRNEQRATTESAGQPAALKESEVSGDCDPGSEPDLRESEKPGAIDRKVRSPLRYLTLFKPAPKPTLKLPRQKSKIKVSF
ncbi:MAG: hypothetical protein JSS95_06650 [Acidobacteria bacterium]|nr:hypothetical protein [Acidobacteriota bacterium]